jgi:hypothetical protein
MAANGVKIAKASANCAFPLAELKRHIHLQRDLSILSKDLYPRPFAPFCGPIAEREWPVT